MRRFLYHTWDLLITGLESLLAPIVYAPATDKIILAAGAIVLLVALLYIFSS